MGDLFGVSNRQLAPGAGRERSILYRYEQVSVFRRGGGCYFLKETIELVIHISFGSKVLRA